MKKIIFLCCMVGNLLVAQQVYTVAVPYAQLIEKITQFLAENPITEIVEKTDENQYSFGFRLLQAENYQQMAYLRFDENIKYQKNSVKYSIWGIKINQQNDNESVITIKLITVAPEKTNIEWQKLNGIQSSGQLEQALIRFLEKEPSIETPNAQTEIPQNSKNEETVQETKIITDTANLIAIEKPKIDPKFTNPAPLIIENEKLNDTQENSLLIDFQSIVKELKNENEEKALKLAQKYYTQNKTIPFRRQAFDYEKRIYVRPNYGNTGQDLNTIGQLILASLYFSHHVDNLEKAIQWYEKAAENQNVEAIMNLADYYQSDLDPSLISIDKNPNLEQELFWLKKAAELNYLEAKQLLHKKEKK